MSAAYWMLRSEDCSTAKRILIGHISVENPCCKAVEQNSGDNSGKSIHQIVRLYIDGCTAKKQIKGGKRKRESSFCAYGE